MTKKFNPKEFLNAEILSPLEQNKIRGGFADLSASIFVFPTHISHR